MQDCLLYNTPTVTDGAYAHAFQPLDDPEKKNAQDVVTPLGMKAGSEIKRSLTSLGVAEVGPHF